MIPIMNFYTIVWIEVPDPGEEKPPQRGTRIHAAARRRRSPFRQLGEHLAAALDALGGTAQRPAPARATATR
jgi:hypothetical protein